MVSAVTNIEWLGQGRISHADARAQVVRAFESVYGREPKLQEAQFVQAVGLCESGYGSAWSGTCGGAGIGSNNMGAIQKFVKKGDPCGADAFPCIDHDEHGVPYNACFRKYPTVESGFRALIQQVYKSSLRKGVLEAAATGNVRDFSTALRKSRYFQLGLESHIKAMKRCLGNITDALNEPMPSRKRSTLSHTALVVGIGAASYFVWKWFL